MLEKCSLWKSSETVDDMKMDSSSDTDSSSENIWAYMISVSDGK